MRAGFNKYFTGRACRRGHVSDRYVSGGGCVECYLSVTPEERARRNGLAAAWRARNQDRLAAYKLKYGDRYKERYVGRYEADARNRRMLQHYGETAAEIDARIARAGYRCEICLTDQPGAKGWHVDHDHDPTDLRVRGILCHSCNVGLGFAKDSVPILKAMIAYLERHRAKEKWAA